MLDLLEMPELQQPSEGIEASDDADERSEDGHEVAELQLLTKIAAKVKESRNTARTHRPSD